jgi:hypothetical protein
MTEVEITRGALLRRFDLCAASFADDCAQRAQGGAAIGRRETEDLWGLASSIAETAAGWACLVNRLDLARRADVDPAVGASLILECVFDPALEPPAWRVLAAALALAQ